MQLANYEPHGLPTKHLLQEKQAGCTMYLKAVLIRFFKSFNFDYLRKNHSEAKRSPWEEIGGAWFPFVRVPLLQDITTVVGANESGKSHEWHCRPCNL